MEQLSNRVGKILLGILPEFVLIFCMIFTINNFIGNVDKTIKADAIGYYDYLPSIFIHNDFVRKNDPDDVNHEKYRRIDQIEHNAYNQYGDFSVNKYPIGTAILQSPFFLWEYYSRSDDVTGYENEFHRAIFYAAIFYVFLGLVFFRKALLLFDVNRRVIFFCQIVVVFATPLIHFANFDAGFSHVYSFFAVSMFAYFMRSYFLGKRLRYFLFASLSLGLIFILRNPSLLVLLSLPLLAGTWNNFTEGVKHSFARFRFILSGFVLFLLIASIQFLAWYSQTGDLFVYSYQGEGFNFTDPHFFDVLFSYQKGLFVYTPVLFFSLLSIIILFIKKQRFIVFSWIFFFVLTNYVVSSWWAWHYGASFGMRVYIDFLLILILPLALALSRTSLSITLKTAAVLLCVATIPVNIIQSYQFKEYILHWDSMDKEKYWKVFLKTDPLYEGILWRNSVNLASYSVIKTIDVPAQNLSKSQQVLVIDDTLFQPNIDVIHIEQTQSFKIKDRSKIVAYIFQNDSLTNYLDTYLLHLEKEGFNKKQEGSYDMRIENLNEEKPAVLRVYLQNDTTFSNTIEALQFKYLRKKE